MKKLSPAYIVALLIALCAPAAAFWHGSISGGSPSIPTLVAGSFAPSMQTPLMPSASTWPPSCLDATWGTGCNTSTKMCTAPTSGAKVQTCTPPKEFIVTGGTGNGTTATVNYTSYAHYAYPVGTSLIVSGATQANWNTPPIGVTSFTAGTGGCAPSCTFTLGFATQPQIPFPVGKQVYVGQVTGNNNAAGPGVGWQGFVINSFTGAGFPQATTYVNVPVVGCSGPGSCGTVSVHTTSGGGPSAVYRSVNGPGVHDSDVLGIDASGTPGLQGLTSFIFTAQNSHTQSPNGLLTVSAASTSSATFSTGSDQLIGTLNTLNNAPVPYNGTIILPWVVTASSCVSNACTVSFGNPNSCASSCVSSSTQIAAGQSDDVIMAWHYGETVQNSLQNGDVRSCVIPKHISPIQFVQASLDGGPWSTVTTPIVDPWGLGKSTLSAPATNYSYCFHFAASSVSDGLHEVRAISCATTGICHVLSSTLTVDLTSGSTIGTAAAHGLQGFQTFGITNSFDAAFQNYDWRDYIANPINSSTGVTVTSGTGAGSGSFTLGFTQPTNLQPLHANEVVNVAGVVTNNSCNVTGGTPTGASLTITYSGSCNFPTGSSVNIAGVTLGTTPITSWTYNSGTGVISITMASAPNGASPTTGVDARATAINQYNLTLLGTGAGVASLQGTHTLVSSSAAGTVMNFQDTTGLTVATTTTGTLTGNALPWNTGSIPARGTAVVTGGTTSIVVSSVGTSVWASGGTVTANWNGDCVVSSASSGSVTCPTTDAATTRASGGTITASGNLYCTVGGSGDWPSPHSNAAVQSGQMTPETFQLQAQTVATPCTGAANTTNCVVAPCGRVASQNETLWLTRKDAGLDERSTQLVPFNSNGSFWVLTNAGGTIKKQDAYWDSWNQTVQTDCAGPVGAAGSTLVAYTGHYCNEIGTARNALIPDANGLAQTLTNPSSCLLFTNAINTGNAVQGGDFFVGEPVVFTGLDTNTNPQLGNWTQAWIKSISGDDISLSATPGGPCINETPSLIFGGVTGTGAASTAQLWADIGTSSVLLACDSTSNANQSPCDSTHPQSYSTGIFGTTQNTAYAKSGFFGIRPDTAAGSTFPATKSEINMTEGTATWFSSAPSQGGNVEFNVDSNQPYLQLTTAVAINKTPGILTPTGGSLSGGNVTLNYATFTGGEAWQVPTTGNALGQGLVVSGVLPADWNCGTAAVPCHVVSATSSSVTFTPSAATSTTYVSGGKILPASIMMEFAPGTFNASTGSLPKGSCFQNGASVNTKNNVACISIYTPGSGFRGSGTSNAFPFSFVPGNGYSTNLARTSNCLPMAGGQSAPSLLFSALGAATTPLNIYFNTGGATNDVLELTNGEVQVNGPYPFQAFNNCGTGPFYFSNNIFTLASFNNAVATQSWAHDRDVNATWYSNWNGIGGDLSTGTTAGNYVSNGKFTGVAVDQATYAWGTDASYNGGICANQAMNVVSVRCIGSQQATPFSQGGGNLTGAVYGPYWSPITSAADASGTPTTCTVNSVTGPCITSATKIFGLATGTIPSTVVPTNVAHIDCNMTGNPMPAQVQTIGSNQIVSTFNNSTNPATVTMMASPSITSNCLLTNSPTITFFNGQHIDMLFYDITGSVSPANTNLNWLYFNDTVYENLHCSGCVEMQALFFQGGNYFNMAYDDDDFTVGGLPQVGQQFSINGWDPAGAYLFHNQLIRNSNVWGSVKNPPDSFNTGFEDVFAINVSGGPTAIGYPNVGNLNLYSGGWGAASVQQQLADSFMEQIIVWPSLAGGVDINGLPSIAGTPFSGNFGACPWYCTATDTGLGNF